MTIIRRRFGCYRQTVTETNPVYEHHILWGMTFKAGETCDQFVVRLHQQAPLCEFNNDAQMSEAVGTSLSLQSQTAIYARVY